jgi:hypothetical protein
VLIQGCGSVLFYPTALYANWAYKMEKMNPVTEIDAERGEADETSALLGGE